jgi:hypothetical protein
LTEESLSPLSSPMSFKSFLSNSIGSCLSLWLWSISSGGLSSLLIGLSPPRWLSSRSAARALSRAARLIVGALGSCLSLFQRNVVVFSNVLLNRKPKSNKVAVASQPRAGGDRGAKRNNEGICIFELYSFSLPSGRALEAIICANQLWNIAHQVGSGFLCRIRVAKPFHFIRLYKLFSPYEFLLV